MITRKYIAFWIILFIFIIIILTIFYFKNINKNYFYNRWIKIELKWETNKKWETSISKWPFNLNKND